MYLHEENSGRKHKNANGTWLADAHLALPSLLWLSSVPLTITTIVRAHLAARNGSPIKRGLWENSGTSEGHLLLENRDLFVLLTPFCWINLRVGTTKIWIQAGSFESPGRASWLLLFLHTIPAPSILFPNSPVHIPSFPPSLSFLVFWKEAVNTGSCYIAMAGLVFTMHVYIHLCVCGACTCVHVCVWKPDLNPTVSFLRSCPLELGDWASPHLSSVPIPDSVYTCRRFSSWSMLESGTLYWRCCVLGQLYYVFVYLFIYLFIFCFVFVFLRQDLSV